MLMRTRETISEGLGKNLESTKHAEVGQEHIQLALLEVLLDIRELLAKPEALSSNETKEG